MPRVPLWIKNPAQNPLNQASYPSQALPYNVATQESMNPISTNPLYRRPVWSYVSVREAPVKGPQPRLAKGTGRTGDPALPGNAAQLPGYLSDYDYEPSGYSYQPKNQQRYTIPIPRTIKVGADGREIVGTYKAHDFTPADRFFHQGRSSTNWQTMTYPPNIRNLAAWQVAQRYRVNSLTIAARPLDSSQYFLGYQVQPQVSQGLGSSGLGYMGSF